MSIHHALLALLLTAIVAEAVGAVSACLTIIGFEGWEEFADLEVVGFGLLVPAFLFPSVILYSACRVLAWHRLSLAAFWVPFIACAAWFIFIALYAKEGRELGFYMAIILIPSGLAAYATLHLSERWIRLEPIHAGAKEA